MEKKTINEICRECANQPAYSILEFGHQNQVYYKPICVSCANQTIKFKKLIIAHKTGLINKGYNIYLHLKPEDYLKKKEIEEQQRIENEKAEIEEKIKKDNNKIDKTKNIEIIKNSKETKNITPVNIMTKTNKNIIKNSINQEELKKLELIRKYEQSKKK